MAFRKLFLLFFLFTSFAAQSFAQSKIIRVYVALCDNDSQGIVPVPRKIGNGNDPDNNLYWGCGYGVRTFFNNSEDWMLIRKTKNPAPNILERCIYRRRRDDIYLIAEAYKGARIKQCTIDFLNAAANNSSDTLHVKYGGADKTLELNTAPLICYVGHSALMDFSLDSFPQKRAGPDKSVMIMCCASRLMYTRAIKASGATPLLWTTNLMCPEAYTLKSAIDGYLNKETGPQLCNRAAEVYNQYQKCGIKGAKALFCTGF
ncbi:MAG TPA: hypothetical protein VNZ86_03960 [Bacteroidia bacterium]|jgi:hypothetical protein|nr:hypothetical protein [Bacteroidia bacterium]